MQECPLCEYNNMCIAWTTALFASVLLYFCDMSFATGCIVLTLIPLFGIMAGESIARFLRIKIREVEEESR